MRFFSCLLVLLGATAFADETALQRCIGIDEDTERLSCYDAAAGRTTAPANSPGEQTDSDPAPVVRTEALPPARPPVADRPSPPAAVDNFGLEQREAEAVSAITSRYDGEFTGWSGRTLFKLENGQVWRQSEPGRFRTSLDRPMITIERGAFSSFRLKIEGLNRSVRVKRIR